MSDITNSTELPCNNHSPLTSPRIIKRVVVRRVVQQPSNNSMTKDASSPPSSKIVMQNQQESSSIDFNKNIQISVQCPSSSLPPNNNESSLNILPPTPPSSSLQLSPMTIWQSDDDQNIAFDSPRMIISKEDESLSSQSHLSSSLTSQNSTDNSTSLYGGALRDNDSCLSPPLTDVRNSLVNPRVKKTDQRHSTSTLPSNNRHSAGGGIVFGFLQRIASPLLSSPVDKKQYSSSFSDSPLLVSKSFEDNNMRARSGGKAIANVQLADEKLVHGFLRDCESLREKRKFAELERLCRDFLQRYYSTKSNMAKAHIFLALALREGLLFKDSLRHFEEALELETSDNVNSENSSETTSTTHVHTNSYTIADYAHTLFCDKQYELARENFEKALSVSIRENQSNSEELRSAIILCHIVSPNVESSQKAELIDDLKKSNINHAFTYYVIGLYYENLLDYSKAIEYYTLSLKREPSFDCNYERIGTCQSKIGLLERAKCNLDMACTLNKQNFKAMLVLAKLHLRAGMTGSCKTKLKIIVERSVQLVNSSSDKQRLYIILAESFYLLGVIKSSCEFESNFEKIKSLFREAIHYYSLYHELVQDDPEELSNYSIESYYNTIGLCHLYMKEYETAMDVFHKASLSDPKSCDGIYNKGVVMEELGLFKEALQYYSKALNINPNDQDSTYAIKRVNRKYKNSLFTQYGMIGLDICK